MKLSYSLVRIWYTRLFVLLFLAASYFLLIRSSDGGIFGFDSSFWGQSKLIARFADLRLAIGDRVFPNVLVGEDGWLIFTAERSMDNYQNRVEFSDEKIASIHRKLVALQSRLAKRGIVLLVVIVPDKPTLYPEIVPPEITRFNGESRLNRLLSYAEQRGSDVFVDLRSLRSDASLPYNVYSKTDSHWNDYGIFLAYQAILQKLKKSLPQLDPYPIDQFEIIEEKPEALDLAHNIGAVNLLESYIKLTPKFENPVSFRALDVNNRRIHMAWTKDDSLPRLLMYHDSFGSPLSVWLALNFRETISVPHYSGGTIWSLDWIEQTDPDVVVIEFAERYLHDLDALLGE